MSYLALHWCESVLVESVCIVSYLALRQFESVLVVSVLCQI